MTVSRVIRDPFFDNNMIVASDLHNAGPSTILPKTKENKKSLPE